MIQYISGLDRGTVGFSLQDLGLSPVFDWIILESAPVMQGFAVSWPVQHGLSTILLDKALDMNQSTSCSLFVLVD